MQHENTFWVSIDTILSNWGGIFRETGKILWQNRGGGFSKTGSIL